MAAVDPEDTFKVTDRRGRVEEAESVPKSETRPAPQPGSPPEPDSGRPELRHESDRTLTGLFMMLASSAMMAMGDAPDPMTGEIRRDLDQATELIDLLILLREKTEGNRLPEETQVIDEILYDLQLRFVAATKRS